MKMHTLKIKSKIVLGIENYTELPIKKHNNKDCYLQQFEAICRIIYGTSFNPEYNLLKQKLFSDILTKDNACFIGKHKNRQVLVEASLIVMSLLNTPSNISLITPAQLHILNIELFNIYNTMKPMMNNWLLFKSIIEVWLYRQKYIQHLNFTKEAFEHIDKWYQLDGSFHDGYNSSKTYYSSIVFYPYLLTITQELGKDVDIYLNRYSIYLNTLIQDFKTDGSFKTYGRSLNYRLGCFHAISYGIAKGLISSNTSDIYCKFVDYYLKENSIFIKDSSFLDFDKNYPIEDYMNYGSLYMILTGLLHVG